jgi:hypothetical protein
MTPVTASCPHCRSTLDLVPPGGWCPERERPVLLGRADGIHLLVWCAYCGRDHHGRHSESTECRYDWRRPHKYPCTCPAGTGDGHHAAHCYTSKVNAEFVVKENACDWRGIWAFFLAGVRGIPHG